MINLLNEHIVLENEKVKLAPLSINDLPAFVNYALTEPNTWQYSMVNPGGNAIAMEKYIAFALKERAENKSYTFTVIDKNTNETAGCTRFYDIDFANKVASIGYTWYGQNYRRTGLNRQCKLLLLNYAFDILQLERVEFRADINNAPSIKAMKDIGCTEEGILRSHAVIETGRRTSMVLSILKDEWYTQVKQNLLNKMY